MRREAFEENLDLQPQTERIGNQNKTQDYEKEVRIVDCEKDQDKAFRCHLEVN